MSAQVVESPVVEALVQRMSLDFAIPADEIRGDVVTIYAEFVDARVQTFVPVLVERRLRDLLRARA